MILRRLRALSRSAAVRLAAPRGYVGIETLPAEPDGTPARMPPPLSPAYAALSVDIARARLAAELLTLRSRPITGLFRLPRLLFLYLRLRQATVLANAIVASSLAQRAAEQKADDTERARP